MRSRPTEGTPPKLTTRTNDGADGQLQIGGYLPLTGSLASLGPPEVAGVELAVEEINEAGGVLGKEVIFYNGDSSDSSNFDKGVATIQKQISRGVDMIVGAASSSVTLNTLKQVTGAGILQVSPAATSPDLDRRRGRRAALPHVSFGRASGPRARQLDEQ